MMSIMALQSKEGVVQHVIRHVDILRRTVEYIRETGSMSTIKTTRQRTTALKIFG